MIKPLLKKYHPFLLSLLGGMLYASGFPLEIGHSFILGPLIGFFLFNYSLLQESLKEGPSLKKQLLVALAFSFGFYLLGFYWIPQTLNEFGEIPYPLNQILGIVFSLVIIPQVYLYTLIQRKIGHPILLAIIYVILEEFIPQQFPAHIGHSFLSLTPYFPLRLAPIFGAPIYSFLTAYLALSILSHFKTNKIPTVSYSLISLMIVLNFILPAPYKGRSLPILNIRVVQPNIGNFLKIDSEKGGINSLHSVFDNYFELSTAPSERPLDLIIWPETSFPTLIASDIMKKNSDLQIPGTLSQIIEKTQAELFIGGYDLKPIIGFGDYQSQYNAAFLFGTDKKLKEVYRKIRLIPFGEGLPFGPLNKILSRYITNVSYFAEGESYSLFKTKNEIPFVSVICYEVLFSSFVKEFLNKQVIQPQLLINLTNDSWYGDTAEPHQHLFLAKWRALEFNIPLIRSTNTGITTVIMPDASESPRLTYQEKKVLDVELKINQRKSTIYQRFGLWSVLFLALIFFIVERKFQRL
ncbi:MAG: apolipoprotein N-acyltransferase [Bacteriovorax sp.]|nr:apolipoprotein N-acyltransferase [Bacteriovorax sp.]